MIYTAVVSCWTSARSLLSLFTEMCQKSAKGIPDWYTPVILVPRKLGQEICKLEASIGFMMRSCLNKTKQYPHQNKTTNQPNESHISTELNCLHVLKMPDGSSRSASAIWHETTPTQTLEDAGLVCSLNYDPSCDPLSPVAQRVAVLRNRISKEATKVRWVMGGPNAKWMLSV